MDGDRRSVVGFADHHNVEGSKPNSAVRREYTLAQINWKRSLTDVDMKRRKAAAKERSRLQMEVIEQISNPSLTFEVEHFKLFGSLKKTETEVHNTVPTLDTVTAEKDYIKFETSRKTQPHIVQYNDFYGCIKNEATKPRTPRTPSKPPSTPIFGLIESSQTPAPSSRGSVRHTLTPRPYSQPAGSATS